MLLLSFIVTVTCQCVPPTNDLPDQELLALTAARHPSTVVIRPDDGQPDPQDARPQRRHEPSPYRIDGYRTIADFVHTVLRFQSPAVASQRTSPPVRPKQRAGRGAHGS